MAESYSNREAEMLAIKHEQLGGEQAAAAWNAVMNALHVYARRSECPLGYDVVRWFEERRDAYQAAISDDIQRRAALQQEQQP